MRNTLRIIDSINEWTGKSVRWVYVALILVVVYEVTARYVFTAPTIWAHQTSTMLNCTAVALAWGYTHYHKGHVRVDVLYSHLSERGKAIIDVLCAFFLLFPLLFVLIYAAADFTWVSWTEGEVLTVSYWYPPAWPLRMVVLLALCLFALQGGSEFIRDLQVLIRNRRCD